MMQNQRGAASQNNVHNTASSSDNPQPAPPPSSNSNVLASLPPIMPSIGFSRGQIPPEVVNNDNNAAAADGENDAMDVTVESSQSDLNDSNQNTTTAAAATTNNNNAANENIPPSVKLGNRLILTGHAPRQWAWKSFTSSARRDSAQFHHWVRANVEYADYPYARFDVSLDPIVYTDEEYEAFLQMEVEELADGGYDLITGEKIDVNDKLHAAAEEEKKKSSSNNTSLQQQLSQSNKILPWTKAETDHLVELAQSCDLRWPVIIDRWHSHFSKGTVSSLRRIEDLQHRYYTVGSVIAQRRVEAVMVTEVAKVAEGTETTKTTSAAATSQEGGEGKEANTGAALPGVGDGANATEAIAEAAVPARPESIVSSSSVVADAAKNEGSNASSEPTASISTAQQEQREEQKPPVMPPAEMDALRSSQKLTSLDPILAPPLSLPATGTAHHRGTKMFDLAAERARRNQLDRLWHRSKEEEREEEELRAELRAVEAQLRKLKRSGKHLVPAGSALAASQPMMHPPVGVEGAAGASGAYHHKPPSASTTLIPPPQHRPPPVPIDPFLLTHAEVSASFVSTAPVPTPGTPYLQSGRLFPPAIENQPRLNKNTLKQMGEILEELHVKEPIPTKRCCDLYDCVRKDALTLLVLQKILLRKEAELTAKRSKLASIRKSAEEAKAAAAVAASSAAGVAKGAEEKKQEEKKLDNKVAEAKANTAKAKANKAKRPRADSGGSAGNTGQKKGDDKPKKKPRKKANASPPAAAAKASAAVPAAKVNAVPSSTGQTNAPSAPTETKAAVPTTVIITGKQPRGKQLLPSAPEASSTGPAPPAEAPLAPAPPPANDGTASGNVDAATASAATSSSSAPVLAHPGKTASKVAEKKKPGRKPRGRKKKT